MDFAVDLLYIDNICSVQNMKDNLAVVAAQKGQVYAIYRWTFMNQG